MEKIWNQISEPVLNHIKILLLKNHIAEILHFYSDRIQIVVKKYARHLPGHVVSSEIDDLNTIAQLEFIETLKSWSPDPQTGIWPLAQARILGAMKDHIRYITKTDPSRFYDWITDAAYMMISTEKHSDFSKKIDDAEKLNDIMKSLSVKERKVVIAHVQHELTFQKIGEQINLSESQISRIYKGAIEKMKKQVGQE